ncbi:MAG: MG2 domain-containing protein, partial [Planctomycetota bacterium]
MRSIPWLLLLSLVLVPLSARATPSGETVVIGTGNRLSGRVPVLYVGREGDPAAAGLRRVLRAIEARSDLRLPLTVTESFAPDGDLGPLVVFGCPRPGGVDAGFGESMARRCGAALVLRAENWKDLPEPVSLRVARDLPPAALEDLRAFSRVFATPAETPSPGHVLLALRTAILDSEVVRHLPSAFRRISGEVKGETLALVVEAHRPGRIELSLTTVEGKTVMDPGPVRPIALDEIEDVDGTLVRLTFRGEDGLTGESRVWLRELVPGAIPSIRLEGPPKIPIGDPLLLRLTVFGLDGNPMPGCHAEATLAGRRALAATDAAGSGLLSFGPFSAEDIGTKDLVVRVAGPRFTRRLSAVLDVTPRPRSLLVMTDRPVYRPGGTLHLRATVVDALTRAGIEGAEVTVDVEDPRERKIATVKATTGRFGAAVLEVPLSGDLPEGEYRARAMTDGATAQSRFRVEEIVLPRFSIDVSLAKQVFTAPEPVCGTVRVS